MQLPDTLPAQVYLLAYNKERQRITGTMWLGQILGGAALTDLWLSGHLVDRDGVAHPAGAAAVPADPALRLVWERVSAAPPRRWVRWIGQRHLGQAVRDQLASDGVLRVVPKEHWWRRDRVIVRDTRILTSLHQRVTGALRGPVPVERLDPRDAALVALVVAGEMGAAIPRAQRRAYRRRATEIVTRGGPPVAALRKAVQQARSASAG